MMHDQHMHVQTGRSLKVAASPFHARGPHCGVEEMKGVDSQVHM